MAAIVDPAPARRALRARLLAAREQFAASPAAPAAARALAGHLAGVLAQLEPQCLGSYVAMRGEFDPRAVLGTCRRLALPYCRREPRGMRFRAWDGGALTGVDECGIATPDGPEVVPDVVLAPCVGFTRGGLRLGYGAGYFDRWLAAHPHVIAIGVAWAMARVDEAQLAPQAHDVPLLTVVTEEGVLAP